MINATVVLIVDMHLYMHLFIYLFMCASQDPVE